MIALLNGRSTEGIPVVDRGLAYGDGLFETVKVSRGRPEFLEQHLARLRRDCARLDIYLDIDQLRAEITQCLARHRDGVLKIIITRRAIGRGYQTSPATPAERLLLFFPQIFVPSLSGVQVRLCRQRLAEQPSLAGMKHLNRLEQVLARAEWTDSNIAEGLMLDQSGHLIEGTMSNVFLVRGDAVYTPRLHRCGVAGVIRNLLLRQASVENTAVREADLTLDDLYAADEVFLTNSLIGIWPVLKIDCLYKMHGDVTIAFQNYLHELIAYESR